MMEDEFEDLELGFSAVAESHFINRQAWDERGTLNTADCWGFGACTSFGDRSQYPFDWDAVKPDQVLEHANGFEFGGLWGKFASECTTGELLEGIRIALVGKIRAQRQAKVLAIDIAAGRQLDKSYFEDRFREKFIWYVFHTDKLLWKQRLKSSLQFENILTATRVQMMLNAGLKREPGLDQDENA